VVAGSPHRSARQSFSHPQWLKDLIHYIYGVEPECEFSNIRIKFSKTGMPRYVMLGDKRLFTIRPNDFSLTLSRDGALLLEKCLPEPYGRVWVEEEIGKTVFAKHVKRADPNIRRGVDVLVYKERLIAFGKAVMSGEEMLNLNFGEAVRVRGKVE